MVMKSALARLALAGALLLAGEYAIAQTQQSGPGWIIDPAAQCGTSNPFATGRETISWSGKCLRGRLHGPGVLIWFEDGVETERDEGTFRNGELDGAAVIALADQTTIFGNYRNGVRHGEFMIVATDGTYIQSIYANGTLIGQKALDRTETKAWRDARKGDSRITQLSVDRPKQVAPSLQTGQRQVASAESRPVQPSQQRVAPTPVPPLVSVPTPVPTLIPTLIPTPGPSSQPTQAPAVAQASPPPPALPPATAAPVAALTQTPSLAAPTVSGLTNSRPREVRGPRPIATIPPAPSSLAPIVAPVAIAGARAQAAIPRPPPLMQYVRVDGQRLLMVASYIPGGINMVPTGSLATTDQFGEAKLLRRLLASAAPDPRLAVVAGNRGQASAQPAYRANRIASAAAAAFVGEPRPPRLELRSPPAQLEIRSPSARLELRSPPAQLEIRSPSARLELRSPSARLELRSPSARLEIRSPPPRLALAPAGDRAAPIVRRPTQLTLRGPSATQQRITLRPPPGVPARGAVSAAPRSASAPAAPAARAAPEGGRLALNLAGADLRDATGIILGDILGVRYTVDPDVRGSVAAGATPSLTREELVPWLRGALQTNGADLVITPAGYRVYSLRRASTGGGTLPSLAPPQQAESIFVQGYAAERAGRDNEAAQYYTQLAGTYPTTGIGAMARERLQTLRRRSNAPQRTSALPSEVSMAGAYLCTRRGLYPNNSKWCGFVRSEVEDQLRIEVREISYNGLLAIGFSPTTCTGGVFIGPLSQRRAVTVPRVCMEARW